MSVIFTFAQISIHLDMENKGYRQEKLRAEYPELAKTFESILEGGNPEVKLYRYKYYPMFKTADRKDRGLSLSKIIEIVRANGYEVNIRTKPK
jgi:hypothetical protein